MSEGREWLKQFRTADGLDIVALETQLAINPKVTRRLILSAQKELEAEINGLRGGKIAEMKARIDRLDRIKPIVEDVNDWGMEELRLERPNGPALHRVRQAILDDEAAFLLFDKDYDRTVFDDGLREAQCFVVEHDWAAAFKGSHDFSQGEFRLPYDVCAFEFKLSGRRVIALMTTMDDRVMMQLMVQGAKSWAIDNDVTVHNNGSWEPYHAGRSTENNYFAPVAHFIGAQARAISIALDAEVAEHEVVRAPAKLVRSREKAGRVPPPAYRVVSLARRSRAAALPVAGHEVVHGKVRLHFRRGHWRHFEAHKTWIKWMLVGNPDLGFVDKEYRL